MFINKPNFVHITKDSKLKDIHIEKWLMELATNHFNSTTNIVK